MRSKAISALIIIGLLLFLLAALVCQIYYPGEDPDSIDKWGRLNIDYLHLIILVLLLALRLSVISRLQLLVTSITLGLSLSDNIDRWIFNDNNFNPVQDCILVFIVLVSSFKKWPL